MIIYVCIITDRYAIYHISFCIHSEYTIAGISIGISLELCFVFKLPRLYNAIFILIFQYTLFQCGFISFKTTIYLYSCTVFIQIDGTCHLINTFRNPHSIFGSNIAQYTIKFSIGNLYNHIVFILSNMTPGFCIAT